MGRTPASRLDVPSANTNPQVHEHVPPLRAEAGQEFVEKLMAQGQKNKAPASDAGSSQAPPSKRFRTEPFAGKVAGVRRYKGKQMPTSSGPALKLGPRTESSDGPPRASPPPHPSPAPSGAGNASASPLGGTSTTPEASIEALRTQLAAAQEEKDQLIRQHQEDLSAQKAIFKELKDQLIQLGLKHNEEMKAAQAAAETKLNETLEDASNSNGSSRTPRRTP
nr:uncharacterized protein LOC127304029 [Lolium perenne]